MELCTRLQSLLPEGVIAFDEETRARCASDKWQPGYSLPDAVALPEDVETVSKIMEFANAHHIPVTARGAGVGYVGSAVPVNKGIVLSLEKMNKVLEINQDDFVVVTQPGVITAELQRQVEAQGLFYPPDPAGRAESSIGGNVITNAGGPRCLKYGVTRDYLLALQVVLADGTIVRTGRRTHKNKTGFDLSRIFVGSEGLLGIVTEITLKLLPLPPARAAISVGFNSMEEAARAIRSIFKRGFLPCAMELGDEYTLQAAWKRTHNEIFKNSKAHLILEIDGQEDSVRIDSESLTKILKDLGGNSIILANGNGAVEKIWEIRREFSYGLRDTGLKKLNNDIVVPRSKLEEFFRFTEGLYKKYGLPVACFGHAGDGNIHTNVMVDTSKPGNLERGKEVVEIIMQQVLDWGGVITGEHGIGLAKLDWWTRATTPEERLLHQKLKRTLDPYGILNPGKFV